MTARRFPPGRLAALALACAAPALNAQSAPTLPFAPGETLVYRAAAGLGRIGQATLRVEGPTPLRDRETYLLRFEFRGKLGPFRLTDETRSWLDPERFASLRYEKRERQPLRAYDERVEIFPEAHRWQPAGEPARAAPTGTPLDELSFLFLLRTLPLAADTTLSLVRHFDPARNPVAVRVLRRERVRVPAGEFATVLVEMRVRDPRHFGGQGRIRLHLTDDERRLPVRIETAMPGAGTVVLALESFTPAPPIAGRPDLPREPIHLSPTRIPPFPDTAGTPRRP